MSSDINRNATRRWSAYAKSSANVWSGIIGDRLQGTVRGVSTGRRVTFMRMAWIASTHVHVEPPKAVGECQAARGRQRVNELPAVVQVDDA